MIHCASGRGWRSVEPRPRITIHPTYEPSTPSSLSLTLALPSSPQKPRAQTDGATASINRGRRPFITRRARATRDATGSARGPSRGDRGRRAGPPRNQAGTGWRLLDSSASPFFQRRPSWAKQTTKHRSLAARGNEVARGGDHPLGEKVGAGAAAKLGCHDAGPCSELARRHPEAAPLFLLAAVRLGPLGRWLRPAWPRPGRVLGTVRKTTPRSSTLSNERYRMPPATASSAPPHPRPNVPFFTAGVESPESRPPSSQCRRLSPCQLGQTISSCRSPSSITSPEIRPSARQSAGRSSLPPVPAWS